MVIYEYINTQYNMIWYKTYEYKLKKKADQFIVATITKG